MKTIKTTIKLVSFVLLTAVLTSMCVNYAFAAEKKFDETEYLKKFISEEYIVSDQAILQNLLDETIKGKGDYTYHTAGCHQNQGGELAIYFQPMNTDPEILEMLNAGKIPKDFAKNELGKYFNLDNDVPYMCYINYPYIL